MFSGLLSQPGALNQQAAAERIWQTLVSKGGLVLFEVLQKQTHISQCFRWDVSFYRLKIVTLPPLLRAAQLLWSIYHRQELQLLPPEWTA